MTQLLLIEPDLVAPLLERLLERQGLSGVLVAAIAQKEFQWLERHIDRWLGCFDHWPNVTAILALVDLLSGACKDSGGVTTGAGQQGIAHGSLQF